MNVQQLIAILAKKDPLAEVVIHDVHGVLLE